MRMILLTFMKELKLLSCEKMEVTMQDLKPRIHENGMDYVLVGDYYVPDLKLPEEHRPIGHWGRLHQSYLKQFRPMVYRDRKSTRLNSSHP